MIDRLAGESTKVNFFPLYTEDSVVRSTSLVLSAMHQLRFGFRLHLLSV